MQNFEKIGFTGYLASPYSGRIAEEFKKEYMKLLEKTYTQFEQKMVSAAQYYIGKPDGKFFTKELFDDKVVNAKKAYITLNTIMGGETSERDRFNEGKKQIPELITAEGIKKMIDLFACLAALAVKADETTTDLETVRACRQSEIKLGVTNVQALTSTTKLSVDEIMALGYGDKNGLAICKYKFKKGAAFVDMENLGEAYFKPEEREVLLLMGTMINVRCCGEDNRYLGKDGKPAMMYEIEVLPKPDYLEVAFMEMFTGNAFNMAKECVFDEKIIAEVREFYEQLNTATEFPEIPDNYIDWKEAFQYLVMFMVRMFD